MPDLCDGGKVRGVLRVKCRAGEKQHQCAKRYFGRASAERDKVTHTGRSVLFQGNCRGGSELPPMIKSCA